MYMHVRIYMMYNVYTCTCMYLVYTCTCTCKYVGTCTCTHVFTSVWIDPLGNGTGGESIYGGMFKGNMHMYRGIHVHVHVGI